MTIKNRASRLITPLFWLLTAVGSVAFYWLGGRLVRSLVLHSVRFNLPMPVSCLLFILVVGLAAGLFLYADYRRYEEVYR